MSENGEIYTAGKNFTLPPALMAWTNSTSVYKKVTFCKFACKGWNPTRRGKTGGLWNGELILKRFR